MTKFYSLGCKTLTSLKSEYKYYNRKLIIAKIDGALEQESP